MIQTYTITPSHPDSPRVTASKGIDRGWALAFRTAPLHPGTQTSLARGAQAQHARHTPLRANPSFHFPRNPPIFKMERRICLLPPTASPPPCAQVVDGQEPGTAGCEPVMFIDPHHSCDPPTLKDSRFAKFTQTAQPEESRARVPVPHSNRDVQTPRNVGTLRRNPFYLRGSAAHAFITAIAHATRVTLIPSSLTRKPTVHLGSSSPEIRTPPAPPRRSGRRGQQSLARGASSRRAGPRRPPRRRHSLLLPSSRR